MALIDRMARQGFDLDQAKRIPQLSGDLLAGEDLDHLAPCYVKISDGRVYMSNGTAANEASKVDGITASDYKTGEPVTLFQRGARFQYNKTSAVGDVGYLGTTKGRFDSAAQTGGAIVLIRFYKVGVAYLLNLQ